jgi:hypothetical protein
MFFCKSLERGAAEAAQCGIAHRDHRRRTRQSVDQRKLADDVASADEGKDALVAGGRNHRDLEESVLDAIAVVAGIRKGTTLCRRRAALDWHWQTALSKDPRQTRQQVHIFRLKAHTGRSSV